MANNVALLRNKRSGCEGSAVRRTDRAAEWADLFPLLLVHGVNEKFKIIEKNSCNIEN